MTFLLIGASGFIGKHVTHQLQRAEHHVSVFHRGVTRLMGNVDEILGDRNDLKPHAVAFRQLRPDVVVDFTLSNEGQAKKLVGAFGGFADRIVAISSADVYRACGISHGFEDGPLQPLPLTEESELRTKQNVYTAQELARLRHVFSWLGDEYDKIPAERTIMGDQNLRGTVLRLPMVYGPGDPLHRLFPYLKRMDDNRPAILLQDDAAAWRGPRGYVENVAAAITLAAMSPVASGKIYNIAERNAFSEADWIHQIAKGADWHGAITAVPRQHLPVHLQTPYRYEQHWIVSSKRIRDELGFEEPVDFSTGLAHTIAWEREHPPAIDPAHFDYDAEDAALALASSGQC